ncbi:hypothetical protein EBN15_19540 [Xanthomonas cucurbitae]|nr:hypothetical protein EBN15_19540 [Xanthomonas cucurbitae]
MYGELTVRIDTTGRAASGLLQLQRRGALRAHHGANGVGAHPGATKRSQEGPSRPGALLRRQADTSGEHRHHTAILLSAMYGGLTVRIDTTGRAASGLFQLQRRAAPARAPSSQWRRSAPGRDEAFPGGPIAPGCAPTAASRQAAKTSGRAGGAGGAAAPSWANICFHAA